MLDPTQLLCVNYFIRIQNESDVFSLLLYYHIITPKNTHVFIKYITGQ